MSIRHRVVAGALAASVAGLAFITGWEKRELQAYPDPALGWAVPTICDGHTGPDVRRGMAATTAMCDAWLAKDTQISVAAVVRCTGNAKLHRHELDALVSFIHNVGPTAFCSSTMARLIRAGDYAAVGPQFDRWVYAGGKRLRGLVNRRAAERNLWERGDYGPVR